MHIEPGFIAAPTLLYANAVAGALCLGRLAELVRRPGLVVRSLLSAAFFSLFMQSFHLSVGPSELHFIGASIIYFTLGFIPTMLGFPLGLLTQGLLFAPTDLVHLGVNSLSLMLPLLAAHALCSGAGKSAGGRTGFSLGGVTRFDAVFHGGVVSMVAFWLGVAQTPTPALDWARWALSYAPMLVLEPLATVVVVRALGQVPFGVVVQEVFDLPTTRP